MAGWDGDALAGQMEDAMERAQQAAEDRALKDTSSREGRAREAQVETLRLTRARVVEQLQRATNPTYRNQLEKALRDVDEKISE